MMSLLKHCRAVSSRISIRCFASGSDTLIDVKTDDKGIVTVTMNRPPVNSLNMAVLEAMHRTFVALEKDKCRGMILTSSSPTVFSAGLDIMEIYKTTVDRARQFWRTLQDIWIKLYSSPYPTVAIINGHSPAGGCLLALCCEYRVIVPKVVIGFNEAQLGIVAPRWCQDSMRNVIGDRKAEMALTEGRLFTSDEALSSGLVDEIVQNKEEGIAAAHKFLAVHSKLPPLARSSVKIGFRKDTLSRLLNSREEDTKQFIDFVFQPKVQEGLGKYLENLKKKQ